MLRRLTPIIALIAAGCAPPQQGREAAVAQCQLDVHSYQGATFRKNYADGRFTPTGKDSSYREYVLLCMETKGFKFALPMIDDRFNSSCWTKDEGDGFPDASVDIAVCYERGE